MPGEIRYCSEVVLTISSETSLFAAKSCPDAMLFLQLQLVQLVGSISS